MSAVIDRRQLMGILAAIAVPTIPSVAQAQEAYPAKQITWLYGFPPGGPGDVISRLLASELGEILKQSVIVENRPGGGGALAMSGIANAAKDGYTIGLGNLGPLIIAPILQKLPYTYKNFTPITKVGDYQTALIVSSDLGVTTVAELIALIKQNPGKYNYASDGIGTSTHLAFELFLKQAGELDVVHIPLKGSPDILRNYGSGNVHMSITNLQSVSGQIAAGQLKALAVLGSQHLPSIPDVPTMLEAGIADFDFGSFIGLIGPEGLPDNVNKTISDALGVILAKPEVRQRLEQIGGMVVDYQNTDGMNQTVVASDLMMRGIIESVGITIEN